MTTTFVQDTFEVLDNLNEFGEKHMGDLKNCFIITADVESLYPSLKLNQMLNALQFWGSISKIDDFELSTVCEILKYLIENTYFKFNESIFKQKDGVPMGCNFAVHLSNITLWYYEHTSDELRTKNITFFKRYVDDLLIFYKNMRPEKAMEKIQNIYPKNFKLTFESKKIIAIFLDLSIKIYDQKIITKVYHKPLDKRCYLNFKSEHPVHIFTGIIIGLLKRYICICSEQAYFEEEKNNLFKILKNSGYPDSLLYKNNSLPKYAHRKKFLLNIRKNREKNLENSLNKNQKSKKYPLYLKIGFKKSLPFIKYEMYKIFEKHWETLPHDVRQKNIVITDTLGGNFKKILID